MKIFIIASGFGVAAIIGLSSVQLSPNNMTQIPERTDRIATPANDSVGVWEVRQFVEANLIARLEGQGGIQSSWQYMDKSGHRTMAFTNVDYNFKNVENSYIQMSDKKEVFGDVIRMDGSFRSHVCSFKIVYPEMEIFARRSVLDEWQGVVGFTGVEVAPPLRTRGLEFEDLPEPIEATPTKKKPRKLKKKSQD